MGQADPILTKLGAGPAVKKLVETALILSNSQDPNQRNHAYSFMESAIKELEDHDATAGVQEEELDNHNNGPREDGSEQSTQNEEPFSGEGKDTTNGEKPMQDLEGTENQMSETGMIPGMPQMPPQMNGAMNGFNPGLDPNIAAEMGAQMPPMPQMNGNQQQRQMQYAINETVKYMMKEMVAPVLHKQSKSIQEIKMNSGTMKLDLNNIKEKSTASFRETVPTENFNPMNIGSLQPHTTNQRAKVAVARSEIEQMDKMLNSQKNPMYN